MNTNDKDKKKSEGKVEGARGVIDMKEKELQSLRAREEEFEQAITRLQEMKTEYEVYFGDFAVHKCVLERSLRDGQSYQGGP